MIFYFTLLIKFPNSLMSFIAVLIVTVALSYCGIENLNSGNLLGMILK